MRPQPQRKDEKILIQKAMRGNRRAAGELLSLYYREIYAFCYRQLCKKEEAMDMTQEIFVSVLRGLSGYQPEKASFRTWLYAVASRCLISRYRSAAFKLSQNTTPFSSFKDEKAHPLPLQEENALQTALENKEKAEELLHLLSGLELISQEIFRMKVFGERTFREIGEALSLPEATVKTRYYRAVALLRKEVSYP